jgi:formylmethanofuran dehydrogenase subunit E
MTSLTLKSRISGIASNSIKVKFIDTSDTKTLKSRIADIKECKIVPIQDVPIQQEKNTKEFEKIMKRMRRLPELRRRFESWAKMNPKLSSTYPGIVKKEPVKIVKDESNKKSMGFLRVVVPAKAMVAWVLKNLFSKAPKKKKS